LGARKGEKGTKGNNMICAAQQIREEKRRGEKTNAARMWGPYWEEKKNGNLKKEDDSENLKQVTSFRGRKQKRNRRSSVEKRVQGKDRKQSLRKIERKKEEVARRYAAIKG